MYLIYTRSCISAYTDHTLIRVCSDANELQLFKDQLHKETAMFLEKEKEFVAIQSQYVVEYRRCLDEIQRITPPIYTDLTPLNLAIDKAKDANDLKAYNVAIGALGAAELMNASRKREYERNYLVPIPLMTRNMANAQARKEFTDIELNILETFPSTPRPHDINYLIIHEVDVNTDLNICLSGEEE